MDNKKDVIGNCTDIDVEDINNIRYFTESFFSQLILFPLFSVFNPNHTWGLNYRENIYSSIVNKYFKMFITKNSKGKNLVYTNYLLRRTKDGEINEQESEQAIYFDTYNNLEQVLDKIGYDFSDFDLQDEEQLYKNVKELDYTNITIEDIQYNLLELSNLKTLLQRNIINKLDKSYDKSIKFSTKINGFYKQKKYEKEYYQEINTKIKEINNYYQNLIDKSNEKIILLNTLIKVCKDILLTLVRAKFAERLVSVVEKKKISSTEIQNILGITQQTYNCYTSGKSLPDNTKLIILCRFLNIDMSYILGLSNSTNTEYIPYWDAFNKFQFSPDAFDTLASLKNYHFELYSEIITLFNHLFEEKHLDTLYSISEFVKCNNSQDFYMVKASDINHLKNKVKIHFEQGGNSKDIDNLLTDFSDKLPRSVLNNTDATKLLNIQQNLINLKRDTAANYKHRIEDAHRALFNAALDKMELDEDNNSIRWNNRDYEGSPNENLEEGFEPLDWENTPSDEEDLFTGLLPFDNENED